jgi:hypothetical protein
MASRKCFYIDCAARVPETAVPMLHDVILCEDHTATADTTYCDMCGIIGFRDDFGFATNGDGPFCPPCRKEVQAEVDAEAFEGGLDDDLED